MTASDVQCETTKPNKFFGTRHMMVFLMFLATTVAYATRVSMSIAIVAMTSNNNETDYQIFDWDRTIQDTILSSFFWGYIILQVPAGMLAGRFGGKYLLFVTFLTNGLVNLFVPVAAEYAGWMGVCGCRVLMGLTQGFLYPSIHGLLGQWVPANERSRMGTFVFAGAQLGTIIEMVTAGVLSASRWGWPSVYYVIGIICLLWSACWIVIGASSPGTSRWISSEERKYIEANAGSMDLKEKNRPSTPWKAILTSLPFLSIVLAHSGQSLGFWTLLTEMPSYMNSVLGVDIKSNGMLSALPYVAMYILSFIFSWIADFLISRKILSTTVTRKVFNTIAFWGPAAALLALSYIPKGHLTLSVVLLTVTVGLNGAHYVGFMISHIDLSPNFASTLMGISNGFSNILSILAPLSVSLVIKDETQASEWRKVFFISIAFYFFSNLFYIIFMIGKIQPWNEPTNNKSIENAKKSSKYEKNSMGEEKF